MAGRILTIQANDSTRDLVSKCLERAGYDVVGVHHGVEALQEMHRVLPDLLLIDQDVPVGGVRTARILRLNPRYRPIPVLISIRGDRSRALSQIQTGRAAGIRSFLVKPYTPSLLVERVARELTGSHNGTPLNMAQIREEIQALSDLPAMSHTHGQIIEMLSRQDAEVDIGHVVWLIETDPSLVTTILKIARSAHYGFSGSFVRGAITYLGLKRLREIVFAATVLNIFEDREGPRDTGGFSALGLWRHSVACGAVMEMLSRQVRGRTHFLLGLLHDIGKVILNFRFSDYFKEVLRIANEKKQPLYDVEKEILGFTHAEVGHVLASSWGLPAELVSSIAYHHCPSEAQMHKRLAALARFSDIAVRTMEIGCGGDSLVPEMDSYTARLRITLDSIVRHKEEIIDQVESIVSVRTSEDEL